MQSRNKQPATPWEGRCVVEPETLETQDVKQGPSEVPENIQPIILVIPTQRTRQQKKAIHLEHANFIIEIGRPLTFETAECKNTLTRKGWYATPAPRRDKIGSAFEILRSENGVKASFQCNAYYGNVVENAPSGISRGNDTLASLKGEKDVLIFDLYDERMVKHLSQEFMRNTEKDISGHPMVPWRLRAPYEKATPSSITQTTSEIDSSYEGVNFYSTITRANFGEIIGGIIVPTPRNTTIVTKRDQMLQSKEEIDKIEQKVEKYQSEIKLPNILSYGKIKINKFSSFCFDPVEMDT